ncbi:PA14 domain-containing protein [Flavobacterium antarcticum]|uniref:PA14 domain-containing protein n=1 Tax=Flavobacterium antarcticum TaxID=271155 RepID=UPI0003B5090C|nr:PA14 domain-containing protein [Flavobacterium antarcticum]
MKRLLVLFVVLLPVIVMGQVDLVRWNGFDKKPDPTLILTDGSISSNPVGGLFVTDNYGSNPFSGFRGTNYNTSATTPDYNNFIEFSIKAKNGFKIDLSEFKFIYANQPGGPRNFEVRYSTDTSNGTFIETISNVTSSPKQKKLNLTGLNVQANQTFYIRIYPFNRENVSWSGGTFHIKHGTNDNFAVDNISGPTFSGKVVTVCTPQGDQNSYLTDKWLGYTYDLPSSFSYSANTFPTTSYKGYVTENNLNFDRDNAASTPGGNTVNLCNPQINNFAIRYRRNVKLDSGNYIFTVGGDDGYRLSIDGGLTWIINNWTDQSYTTTNSSTICIDGNDKKFILEYIENTGNSRVSFKYTKVADLTAPTSISGLNSNCAAGEAITLTAVGSNGVNGNYRWGTGVPGSNIIGSENNATIIVSPTVTTTYWVQVIQCGGFSTAVTKTISIGTPGDPNVFGNNIWNVYAFADKSMTPALTSYKGYYKQNTLGADTQDLANNGWDKNLSPSTSQGWLGCSVLNDNFTIIHKRQGFPSGSYKLTVRNYDDKTQVIIDGVLVRNYTNWYGGSDTYKDELGLFCFDANTKIEVRTIEDSGDANFRIDIVKSENNFAGNTWQNNSAPENSDAIVKSNLTLTQDLTICTCIVKDGITIMVPSDLTLTVIGDVSVEGSGKIIIENNGSFVQVKENASYTGTENSFEVKRHTQPVRRYDFTYWSSPVADWKLNELSPNTLSDKYYQYNPNSSWAILYGGNVPMEIGRGYCVRAPQNFEINSVAVDINTRFIGKPNNGNITFNTGNEGSYNLVGNPYASALSADEFIKDNKDIITGTLYFWTHNTANTNYQYSPADYAAYNFVGGVATQPAAVGGSKPSGNIASGQGFFIERNKTNSSNTLVFNNKMRVIGKNKQFYKTTPTQVDQALYRNRFWINVSNENNAFSELLVGYVSGATDGFDNGYDGATFGGNVISMYSILGQSTLAIQGKSLNFENTDVIQLGYTTNVGGQFKINLTDFDGFFVAQDIFLKDKSNGAIVNLKEMDYSFTTATGTFNERFEILYQNPDDTLGTETPTITANSILVFNKNNQINIKSTDVTIDNVIIYDLQGREIFTKKNVNAQEFTTQSLSVNNQVVIVKVITDTKAELVKKIILN